MNRMWDKNDIIKLIQEYAPGFDPSSIDEGNVPQDAVLGIDSDGDIVKGNLFGKYARVINAPSSVYLADDELAAFTSGCMIEGNFYGYANPVIFPHREAGTTLEGVIMGIQANNKQEFRIQRSYVYLETKAFSAVSGSYIALTRSKPGLDVGGKAVPSYPANTDSKVFACVNGTLQWIENPLKSVAPEYVSTATYSVGALVIHAGLLYQCSTAVTVAEEWDATKWTQTTLAAVIAAL